MEAESTPVKEFASMSVGKLLHITERLTEKVEKTSTNTKKLRISDSWKHLHYFSVMTRKKKVSRLDA